MQNDFNDHEVKTCCLCLLRKKVTQTLFIIVDISEMFGLQVS